MTSSDNSKTAVDVTILMPCLNEAKALPYCIDVAKQTSETLKARGLSSEILISDNGSGDGSPALAKRLGCRVTTCDKRGYGLALIHGCKEARGRYILMGDSDGSYDFREGVAMIEKLQRGFDLCMGNRLGGVIMPGAMPWKNMRIGNPFLSGILNFFFHTGMHDVHCGLRAFTKQAFSDMNLSAPGMEFASELVLKAATMKMKCAEIPITLHPDRRESPSHLRPWRDGFRHLLFILTFGPMMHYMVALVALLSIGLFLLIALILSKR